MYFPSKDIPLHVQISRKMKFLFSLFVDFSRLQKILIIVVLSVLLPQTCQEGVRYIYEIMWRFSDGYCLWNGSNGASKTINEKNILNFSKFSSTSEKRRLKPKQNFCKDDNIIDISCEESSFPMCTLLAVQSFEKRHCSYCKDQKQVFPLQYVTDTPHMQNNSILRCGLQYPFQKCRQF